jgi:hypothetical protein
MQWSKPVVADLQRERRAASFDVWDMTKVIYGKDLDDIEKVALRTLLTLLILLTLLNLLTLLTL